MDSAKSFPSCPAFAGMTGLSKKNRLTYVIINNFTVLSSHKCLRSIIIDFFCIVLPAKPVPGLNREPESRWIQEVGFLDAGSSPA
jgi:hypothetical protein